MKNNVLKINIKDKRIEEILDILKESNIDFSMSSSGLVISANEPSKNDALCEIMEICEDYTLKSI